MSKVSIVGNPSGTGTLSISAPNTNTNRTLALPDADGTVVTGNGSTNTLPARSVKNSQLAFDGGALSGFRNYIINGNMGIYQRGAGAVTVSGYGPADRWVVHSLGNTFSTSQGSFVSGDTLFDTGGAQYYTTIAVTSVANTANTTLFTQAIEDVRKLAGKTVTISFWAKASSGTPSIGVSIDQQFGTGGSTVVTGTGQAQALTTTWTKYTKTFAVPSINGKTIGTEATHYTSCNFWLDAGSDYNTRAGSIGQSSKTVSIAQVQLEEGSVATPFEHRPYGAELALCQRYYCKLGGYTTNDIILCGYITSSGFLYNTYLLPVEMRVPPTATVVGTWIVSNVSQPLMHSTSKTTVTLFASGLSIGQGFASTSTSAQYITLSAEL